MKALLAGWFSFEGMGTTAGDLMARDLVRAWLSEAGMPFSVAISETIEEGGLDWRLADPSEYHLVIFVCGPFGNGYPLDEFLQRFSMSKLIGVNLSLLDSLDNWNPFAKLFERDSSVTSRPDITIAAESQPVPVVGVILVPRQPEYGKRGLHQPVELMLKTFFEKIRSVPIPIDTIIPDNKGNLRSPEEVESLIRKMDLVITTRLHGAVLSIKNKIPVIPIDPIRGGAKVSRQVEALEWPILLNAESLSVEQLQEAFAYCLTSEAQARASYCALRARKEVEDTRQQFIRSIQSLMNSNQMVNPD